MYLKEPKHKILGIIFGSSDKSNRMRDDNDADFTEQLPGIKHGISGGQWEHHVDLEVDGSGEDGEERYKQVGRFSSIGRDEAEFLPISYNKDSFIRFLPTISLRELDEAMFLPILNKSLANKLKAIHLYSDGYKIQEIKWENFGIDETEFEPNIPAKFSAQELADPWVRVRPNSLASAFHVRFFEQTPKRMFVPEQVENSLERRGK
jgi:hypothetical protein